MTAQALAAFVFMFFSSIQVKTILGLIVVDLALGIAASFKIGKFDPQQMARFYATNVVPYVIGYAALWLAITIIIPPSAGVLSDALVTVAWGVLVGSLLGSIMSNMGQLYPRGGQGSSGSAPQA